MTPDYDAYPNLMGFGYSATVPLVRVVHTTGPTSYTGQCSCNQCVGVPSATQGDEPGVDRNGKKPRAPKLPNINRRQWWNR